MNLVLLPLVYALLTTPAQDSSTQLLQEVRRLREAIETMVSTGARVQIVFGRLQLQEQRTATAARRLDEVREMLARATREATERAFDVRNQEEGLRNRRASIPPEMREEMESTTPYIKRKAAEAEAERQRIQNEESLAASTLATEQGRWSELNQQLEELERVLAKRP